MFGHVAGRHRRWRWAILTFLFALAFVWSIAAMGDRTSGTRGILVLGSAVGGGISLLALVFSLVSSARRRRAPEGDEGDAGAEGTEAMGSEGHPEADEATQERARTYEEVFGLHSDLTEEELPGVSDGDGWTTDGHDEVEATAYEQVPTKHQSSPEAESQPVHADSEGAVDRDEGHDADASPEDHLRRMREQFKARAEEAALRVKQREAELQKTASTSDPE